jgi:hypothetical protein
MNVRLCHHIVCNDNQGVASPVLVLEASASDIWRKRRRSERMPLWLRFHGRCTFSHRNDSSSTVSRGRLEVREVSMNGFEVALAGRWDAAVVRVNGVIVNA